MDTMQFKRQCDSTVHLTSVSAPPLPNLHYRFSRVSERKREREGKIEGKGEQTFEESKDLEKSRVSTMPSFNQ